MDYRILPHSDLAKTKVLFSCPDCGVSVTCPLRSAGKPETCPQCKAEFKVPGVAEYAKTLPTSRRDNQTNGNRERAPNGNAASPTPGHRTISLAGESGTATTTRMIAAGVGFGVCLAAVVFFGLLLPLFEFVVGFVEALMELVSPSERDPLTLVKDTHQRAARGLVLFVSGILALALLLHLARASSKDADSSNVEE